MILKNVLKIGAPYLVNPSNNALQCTKEYFISLHCAEPQWTGMQLESELVSHRGERKANVHFILLLLCITNNEKMKTFLTNFNHFQIPVLPLLLA